MNDDECGKWRDLARARTASSVQMKSVSYVCIRLIVNKLQFYFLFEAQQSICFGLSEFLNHPFTSLPLLSAEDELTGNAVENECAWHLKVSKLFMSDVWHDYTLKMQSVYWPVSSNWFRVNRVMKWYTFKRVYIKRFTVRRILTGQRTSKIKLKKCS
jgi:hypothetical protein